MHAAGAGALLGLAHEDERGDADLLGDAREHPARDEADLGLRELALVHVGEAAVEVSGDDGPEDGVPEELEALVGRGVRLALRGRRVRERGHDEVLVLEVVAADLLGRDHPLVHLQ